MDRDELEMVSACGRVATECQRFIARVMDESSGMSTTDYTEPVEVWAGKLSVLLVDVGRHAADWAEARGLVVIDLPPGEVGLEAA